MRKSLSVLVLTVSLMFVGGCGKGMISVDAIGPNLKIVLDRHDAYINSGKAPDGTELSGVQTRTQLRSSRLLRETLEAAKK